MARIGKRGEEITRSGKLADINNSNSMMVNDTEQGNENSRIGKV
jgi:hypothetical protein